LNELLDRALGLPLEQREQWLQQLGPSHARVVPRLRTLLARCEDAQMDRFLGTLPEVAAPGDLPFELPRTHAGPYRLLEKIGSGGMGSVWLAERTDGSVKRRVALKLPQGSWPRQGLAERLTRERDFLAVLNHRHIARLYDAGVTDDGQPYLALEYVDGKPIDEYCRDASIGLRRRLRLFLQIAEAVAHAHAKLIVHRDLKPANILVTADAHVRLLDFGIAKLIEGGEDACKLTELSGRALTLNYAAPEQIAGEPVTIASDVYSLGVVLYELIAGVRPSQGESDSRRALEHAVLHLEPVRPSDRIADRSLRRAVRGDLDAIILKALRKEPERRYSTVNAFADDIVRCLSSRPVTAQRDTAPYRLGKFLSRNRLASVAVGLLLLTLTTTFIIAIGIARSVVADRQRLDIIKTVFADIFQEIDHADSEGVSLVALERILGSAAQDAAATMQPHDVMRVRTEARLALVEHRLGKVEQSRTRLASVLATLRAKRMEATAEYELAKVIEARLARADRPRAPEGRSTPAEPVLAPLL
jgi:eukaryotic-like serine/threonine-protein kinase